MTGAPSKSRGALEVIVFDEARFRGSLMFTSAEVTLGNDPGVMIPLDDPSLSPCHATLHFDGESCTIENYDPLVGTLVNGEAVEHHDVSATDEIQLGRFRLRITVHRADATPAPLSVRSPTRSASSATKIPAKSPPGSARSASAAALKPTSPPPSLAAPAPSVVASVPPPLPMQPEPPRFVSAVPPPRPTSVSPTAARVPPADRRGAPSAPTALAVAPTLAPSPKLEPPTPQRRPTLSSVPAESPAPGRTATRPIGARPIEARIDAAPIEEVRDVSTERNAISPSAGGYSVPTTYTSARDEDDDDDAIFEPSFSLFEKLRAPGTSSSGRSAVEVVRFRHGCILKLQHLRRGEKLRLHGLRKPLGRCSGDGTFVFLHAALPGSVAINRQGKPFDDAAWRKGADQRGRISLDPATQVLFPLPSGEGVLVHLVPAAPPLPASAWRPRLTKLMVALAAVSVVVHLVVFAVLGLASLVRRDYLADNKEGRFARIALKEIELEPPAPPPKQEKKKSKAEPTQTATTEPTARVAAPHIPRPRITNTPQTQSAATAQKLLSALGGLSAGPKPLSATAMSNLNAVGPIHGGGFKVSGAIGKLPGDSLRLASAGSGIGRLDTKSSNDVAKNLGRVLGQAPTGQVRAQVRTKPNMMKVEGHLDRGEIQKVINSHIHELQGCFERQLIVNPNLAGKVTFEWLIGTSGAVTIVKIKASTLSSNEATSCMQSAIHRWQFPAPSGGQVTVIYPIALANSGT